MDAGCSNKYGKTRAHTPRTLIAHFSECAKNFNIKLFSFHRFAVVQVRNTYWADQHTAMIAEGMHNHSEIAITK